MNADQLKGKWMQFKVELYQQWAKFRDDHIVQSDGGYEQSAAQTQERYGDKKDELIKWADPWHQNSQAEVAKEWTVDVK